MLKFSLGLHFKYFFGLKNSVEDIQLLQEKIISTLEYFAIFKYPLLPKEIHHFLNLRCNFQQVTDQLGVMEKAELVFISSEGFYSTKINPLWSVERLKGNKRAKELLVKSHRYVNVIRSFPFVVAVAISGSLSKYYAGKDDDIDYFIITKKNRLWIARTLLHFYKKLTFIRGNENFYCMNYLIDESALEIDQKNIYSAIETVTLLPVYNKELLLTLKLKNEWLIEYLPNEPFDQDLRFMLSVKNEPVKAFFESVINMLGADSLNRFFMKITDRKWRAKWRKKSYPMEHYDSAFYTTLHISKNHPANYQAMVLQALEDNTTLSTQPSCSL